MDYPLDVFTVDAGAVHFVLGGAMVFDGKLNGDKIIGTFTQDCAKGDFILAPHLA
jgi:predicted ribosome-associated RNA-binding protein Tma20